MQTRNPYDTPHATLLAKAAINKACGVGLCDHYVGLWFGWGHTGEETARNHYADIPAAYRETRARAGLLAFYSNGPTKAGHVGLIYQQTPKILGLISCDLSTHHLGVPVARPGKVGVTGLDGPVKVWRMKLLGYANPLFPKGVNPVHAPLYPVPHH